MKPGALAALGSVEEKLGGMWWRWVPGAGLLCPMGLPHLSPRSKAEKGRARAPTLLGRPQGKRSEKENER